MALTAVKRPSDLNLLRKIPEAMQVTVDIVTSQPGFGVNNAKPYHPYGPTITLKLAEDECLYSGRFIKKYIAKTKDREEQNHKLFVTRKMGLSVAICNALLPVGSRRCKPWQTLGPQEGQQ